MEWAQWDTATTTPTTTITTTITTTTTTTTSSTGSEWSSTPTWTATVETIPASDTTTLLTTPSTSSAQSSVQPWSGLSGTLPTTTTTNDATNDTMSTAITTTTTHSRPVPMTTTYSRLELTTTFYNGTSAKLAWFENETTTVTTSASPSLATYPHARCPPPARPEGAQLANHAACLKDRCQDFHGGVLALVTGGRITDCFLLLEIVGSCDGRAASAVPALPTSFRVGDICGEKCPSSCPRRPTTTTTTEESTSSATGELTSTSITTTTTTSATLQSGATLQRVLVGRMSLAVDNVNVFVVDPRVLQALQGSIAAVLKVRAEDVVISSVTQGALRRLRAPPAEDGRSRKGERRRLAPGSVEVCFEILSAPAWLEPTMAVQSADAIKAELNALLQWTGPPVTVSALTMAMPTVEHRMVMVGDPLPPVPKATDFLLRSSAARAGAVHAFGLALALLVARPATLRW
mmetsp:Transcript_34324/g.106563  ORF Transcript_34324/g.106563 Transcript_34324/m.106563 type:complete len:462 (-) Transcript_34324:271-1656(-)